MDGNVVYDPQKQDNQPSEGAPPGDDPAATTDDQQTEDATEQPVEGEETEEGAEEPPPPPAGFLGGGLWKKILIGVVILIVIIVIVVMLIPRDQGTQEVKLEWWGLWEESNAIQSLIIDFQNENPNIEVEYIKRDPADYRELLTARLQNGTGPDIFRYHNSWLPMLENNLLPLSANVITPEQFQEAYYPVMQEDLVQNGAIYGIPMMVDSLALFANPELFEAAGVQVPSNWDDFVKVSKELTVKNANGEIETAGAALGTYNNIKHAPDVISLLFVQQGVEMDRFASSQTNQADALTFYTSFAKGDESVWDDTLDNSLLAFSRGDLAMYFGYSWDVFEIQKLNENLEFKIYPVPELYGNKTTVASYWVEGVSDSSSNQEAALTFMNYLAQPETAEKFYSETAKSRSFGELYARQDLRENLREVPLAYPFLSQLDDASSTFFASDTHDGETGLNSMMNTYLGTAVNSMLYDSESAETAVEKLNNGVQQVFKKYDIKQE